MVVGEVIEGMDVVRKLESMAGTETIPNQGSHFVLPDLAQNSGINITDLLKNLLTSGKFLECPVITTKFCGSLGEKISLADWSTFC